MPTTEHTPSAPPPGLSQDDSRLRGYLLWMIVLWTILLVAAMSWAAWSSLRTAESHALAVARKTLDKDLVYRRWASSHGGVYVPETRETPANPYLGHVPERDLTSPSGKRLTLVNPAYMTRQVHEQGARDYGLRGHITSLTPLRPENAPEPWEAAMLQSFVAGAREGTEIHRADGQVEVRHMRALITEKGCLKCHASQGYREGDVRGGLSVMVPLAEYDHAAWHDIRRSSLLYLLVWLAGLAAFVFGYRSLSRGLAAGRSVQRRYRDLVETSNDLIWQLDREGRIVYLNPAWEKTLGIPVADLLGRPFTEIKDPGDLGRGVAAFRQMMAGGPSVQGQESVFRHQDGRQIHLIINARSVVDQSGAITGCSGTAFDNTERRGLEERLRHSEKMLAVGQLAGGVAHDFNNQLAGIMGYAELLSQKTGDPQLLRYADRIITAARRSADLTGKLLAFARKGQALTVPVDLHACVHETIALLSPAIDPRIALREDLQAGSAQVRGDPSLLQNALLNLGLNARDAMSDGGVITFSSRQREIAVGEVPELQAGAYLELVVSDTGCGMDDHVRAHLFEPFFTTKEPGKGTGMGLAAVYGTVLSHGGRILVSSAPGRGTAFSLLLPALQGESGSAVRVAASAFRPARLRILVAEDEQVVNDLLCEVLRAEGHEVVTVGDGRQAIAVFTAAEAAFDLVILDLLMPEMDGRSCFRLLRRHAPRQRVLLVSGYSSTGMADRLLAEGAAGFLQKPFQADQLRQALGEAIRPATTSQ